MSEAAKTRVKVRCPRCEHLLDVTDIESGRKILCISCEHVIVVPDKRTTRRIVTQKPEAPPPPPPAPPAADEELTDSSWMDRIGEDSGSGDGEPRRESTELAQIDLDAEAKEAEEREKTRRVAGGLRPRVTKTDGQWVDWKTIRDNKPKK